MAKISYWSNKVEELLITRGVQLSDQIELFLRLQGEDCEYYLVDYISRTQFWLETLSSDELGINEVCSPSHLS